MNNENTRRIKNKEGVVYSSMAQCLPSKYKVLVGRKESRIKKDKKVSKYMSSQCKASARMPQLCNTEKIVC